MVPSFAVKLMLVELVLVFFRGRELVIALWAIDHHAMTSVLKEILIADSFVAIAASHICSLHVWSEKPVDSRRLLISLTLGALIWSFTVSKASSAEQDCTVVVSALHGILHDFPANQALQTFCICVSCANAWIVLV